MREEQGLRAGRNWGLFLQQEEGKLQGRPQALGFGALSQNSPSSPCAAPVLLLLVPRTPPTARTQRNSLWLAGRHLLCSPRAFRGPYCAWEAGSEKSEKWEQHPLLHLPGPTGVPMSSRVHQLLRRNWVSTDPPVSFSSWVQATLFLAGPSHGSWFVPDSAPQFELW